MMLLCLSLLSLCLSANAGITVHSVRQVSGENVTLECSFTKCLRGSDGPAGMYFYHYLEGEEEVLFYHNSEKISPRTRYTGRVQTKGLLKNHTITISNLTMEDSGSYRCVYKESNSYVVTCNAYILVVSETKAPADANENNPGVPLMLINAAAYSVIVVAITIFIILIIPRVKQWINRRKVRNTPSSSNDCVYEVMTKSIQAARQQSLPRSYYFA